jgi:hypothetical protein
MADMPSSSAKFSCKSDDALSVCEKEKPTQTTHNTTFLTLAYHDEIIFILHRKSPGQINGIGKLVIAHGE